MKATNLLLIQKVKILEVYYEDELDGKVTVLLENGNKVTACFWGETFKINEYKKVKFSALEFPITWEAIFSENKEKKLGLDSAEEDCSYYAYGKIVSLNPVIADFGDLILENGDWTHDERVIGEYIYWKIDRLEISQELDEDI